MIWTTIAYPKSVIGILTVWMLSRFLLCLRVLTKERITSVVVHQTVFSPITYHANRLLCLHLICWWTICVLRLFPFGAKSENAPHLANGISVTMIEYFIFELKTVHFLLIVSNICLTMFIKIFSRLCDNKSRCFPPVIEGLLYVEDFTTDFRVHDCAWNLFALVVVKEQEVLVNWKIKSILQWLAYPLGSLGFPCGTRVASTLGEQRTFHCFFRFIISCYANCWNKCCE